MVSEGNLAPVNSPNKKRRRRLRILLVALLVILTLVGLAPTIISTDSVRHIAVEQINRRINGELSIDSWSIGWFSGIKLRGISLLDQDSQPLASIKTVSLDPSYLSLLIRSPDLGRISISHPRLELRFGPEGRTNLEETVPGLEGDISGQQQSRRRPSFDLQVDGGTVIVHQQDVDPLSINNIKAHVQMVSGDQPLSFQMSCDFTDSRGAGQLSAQGSVPRREDGQLELTQLRMDLEAEVDQFQLGLLSPLLQRAGLDLKVAGRLDAEAKGRIQGLQNVQLFGQAVCPDIHFSGPLLKTDNFHVRDFAGKLEIDHQDNKLNLKALQLTSDLGAVDARGLAHFVSDGQRLDLSSAQLEGILSGDLAKILNQLPATVRLRPGLKVTGGDFTAKYSVSRSDDGDKLTGTATLKNLQGSVEHKAVQLDEPVEFAFDVTRAEEGLDISQLSLNSGFGDVSLTGRASDFYFRAGFVLDKLSSEMAKFIDLGSLSFAGEVICDGSIRTSAEQSQFQLGITGKEILVRGLGRQDLQEPQLQLNLTGSVDKVQDWPKSTIIIKEARLDSQFARLDLSGRADLDPLALTAQVRLDSDLGRLWNLFSAFRALPEGLQLQADLGSSLHISMPNPQTIACTGSTTLRSLQISRPDAPKLFEPQVLVKHRLNYDLKSKTLASDLLELNLTGLNALVERLELTQQPDGNLDIEAEGNFQADMMQLRPWMLAFGKLDPKTRLLGKSSGRASYSRLGGQERLGLVSEILDLRVQLMDQGVFDEPRIQLDLEADRSAKVFEIRRLKVDSSFLQATAEATTGLGQPGSPAKISLQGRCDLTRLSRLARLLRPDWPILLGSGRVDVNLTGPSPQTISPDWVRSLSGPAMVSFDQQSLSGLSFGPADINMQIDQGFLTVARTAIPANDGAMTIQARVGLAGKKPFLVVSEPVQILDDVQVNPQLSEQILKFINPIFANTHQVAGTVDFRSDSIVIDELDTWKQNAKMTGQFSGKDLRIRSRAGLMQDLAGLLGLDLSAQLGQLSPVTIELADGAVSYQDMHIVFGSLVDLSFSGKVGLDGKLDMKLGLPILPAMLGNRPELIKYLGDQRIYLPITGTVNNPKLDIAALPSVLEPLISEALRLLAADKIGQLFEDLLKKPGTTDSTAPVPQP
ncbi:MAG: hypothetical protein GWP14_07580 [Actinobacteria bacterium]|nr:hypothetical protein [Actinomycetota bacterium]